MTAEEGADLKDALEFLTADVAEIKQQQKTIMNLVLEVQMLRTETVEKDKRIQTLEDRVSDLEQYTRMNDVIVTGIYIKPRSYAKAVTGAATSASGDDDEPSERDAASVEQQVAAFLQDKGIDMDCNDIEACHILPRKKDDRKKDKTTAVIMRFVNRKNKVALMKQGKNLKGTNVYLNEHLTKRNADIARKARFMRKENKIQATWTAHCKVFIKLNGTPEEAKVLCIRSMEELDKHK